MLFRASRLPHKLRYRNRQDEFGEGSLLAYFTGIFGEPPQTYATVQRRVLRWRRTRNFIIISCTISGLIVIGEIAERAEERRQVSTFSSSLGFIKSVREPDHTSLAACDGSPKGEEKAT